MPLTKRDYDNLQRSYRIEDRTCWKIANDLVHKKKADNDDFIILEMMSLVQRHYLRKGSPDQSRDDHGRWTSGGGNDTNSNAQSSGENFQGVEGDSFDVAITAQDHLSTNCLGSVKSVFPGQFLDMEIADIRKLAKEGDAAARRACKIIDQGRFRK